MSLFKSILGAAAPIIGTALGGPVGGMVGGIVGRAMAPTPTMPARLIGPPAMPGGGSRTAAPKPPMRPPVRTVPAAGARAGIGSSGRTIDPMGVVRSVSGKILGVMKGVGTMVSRKRIVKLARSVGIEAAAAAIGVTALIVAQMVMDEQAAPKRGRGITARDL